MNNFAHDLRHVFKEADLPGFDAWFKRYLRLAEHVVQHQPKTIVEIGVRSGYSAWSMMYGLPTAKIIGIDFNGDPALVDTHGGELDYYKHAEMILAGFDFHLMLCDSHKIDRLPLADMIYVDGDHSKQGCWQDLMLASKSTKHIVIDDYLTISGVQEACNQFCQERQIQGVLIEDSATGLFIIEVPQAP